jgi:hypothetical protein
VICETENDSCWRGGTQIHILWNKEQMRGAKMGRLFAKTDAIVASEINDCRVRD